MNQCVLSQSFLSALGVIALKKKKYPSTDFVWAVCFSWQTGTSVFRDCCCAPLIDSDSQHTCWQPLHISNLYIIPGISLLSSLLHFTSPPLSSCLLVENVFMRLRNSWPPLIKSRAREKGGLTEGWQTESRVQRKHPFFWVIYWFSVCVKMQCQTSEETRSA